MTHVPSPDDKPRVQPLRLLGAIAVAPFFLIYVGALALHQAVGRGLSRLAGD